MNTVTIHNPLPNKTPGPSKTWRLLLIATRVAGIAAVIGIGLYLLKQSKIEVPFLKKTFLLRKLQFPGGVQASIHQGAVIEAATQKVHEAFVDFNLSGNVLDPTFRGNPYLKEVNQLIHQGATP